jgi:Kef-type K+ transport system membrane component KefB
LAGEWGSFVVVAVIALASPLALGMAPRLLVPAIVLEVVAGIVVGPSVLDWARVSGPVDIFSQVGLAALLFLAGREIDVRSLVGPVLKRALAGFALSLAVVLLAAGLFDAAGLLEAPLLVAICLAATSMGIVVVPLRDAGEADTPFGREVLASAAVAEFGAVLMLAAYSSTQRGGIETEIVHMVGFGAALAVIAAVVIRVGRVAALRRAVARLEGTSSQIAVRSDMVLLAIILGLAAGLGVEVVLAAFAVGLIRGIVDEGTAAREKAAVVTFGVFVPFFFVGTGIAFDLGALIDKPRDLLEMGAFVVALLATHGAAAIAYRRVMAPRRLVAASLLGGTSLSLIIVATELGRQLGVMSTDTTTALVGAGMISVLAFPALALTILRRERQPAGS